MVSIRVLWGPIVEPAPTTVAPCRAVPGSMRASGAIETSASITVLAGSTIVAPASIRTSEMRRWASVVAAAS